jgi:hypothetical protein
MLIKSGGLNEKKSGIRVDVSVYIISLWAYVQREKG